MPLFIGLLYHLSRENIIRNSIKIHDFFTYDTFLTIMSDKLILTGTTYTKYSMHGYLQYVGLASDKLIP